MSPRTRLPASVRGPLHTVAQHAYVTAGRATAAARMRPDFVLVGASRSGTTSLFTALTAHPDVRRPAVNKGVRYFDLNYQRDLAWYLGHFPLRPFAGAGARTFEASGYYLFHPLAVPRLAHDLPDAKIVMMLRDPVERAYSAWKHESARGFEDETFERALELEEGRLAGQEELIAARPGWESVPHRHQSYRARGEYAPQLRRVLEHVPREQVHVIISEDYFARPAETTAALVDFLGLAPAPDLPTPRLNARPGAEAAPGTTAALRAHFAPYNEELTGLLGRDLPWG